MGNMLNAKANKEQTSSITISRIDSTFYPKIFSQNRKTVDVLMKQIESLYKKLQYIPFQWAQLFLSFLKSTQIDQHYSQYQHVLLYNCRHDHSDELVVHALKLRETFIRQINCRYNTTYYTMSIAKLKEVVYEAKCYFMVMGWLHSIASLEQVRAKNDLNTQKYTVFRHDEKVYNFIIQITTKTYQEYLSSTKGYSIDFDCTPQFQNCQVVYYLEQISNCKHFDKREKEIVHLQQALAKDEQNLEKYFFWMQKVFGKSKIFSYLYVVKEIGHIDVSYLWGKLYGDLYNDLFQ